MHAPAKEYKLTRSQRDFWLLNMRKDYQNPDANRLAIRQWRGQFSLEAFRSAIYGLFEHNESMRLAFSIRDGMPQSFHVLPEVRPRIELYDFSKKDALSRYRAIAAVETGCRFRRFDVTRGDWADCFVIKCSSDEFIYMINFHHLLLDAASFRLTFDTVLGGAVSGSPPDAARPLATQSYLDYASYEAGDGFRRKKAAAFDYWIPKIRARETDFRRMGKTVREVSGASSSGGLHLRYKFPDMPIDKTMLSTLRLRISDIFILSYFIMQYRLTGVAAQGVLLVNNGRDREFDPEGKIIGLFIGLLPLFYDIAGEKSVRDSVKDIQTLIAEQIAYNQISWVEIVDKSYGSSDNLYDRVAGRIVFNFVHMRGPGDGFDLNLEPGRFYDVWEGEDLGSDLRFQVFMRENAIWANIIYRKDKFNSLQMRHLVLAYDRLLRSVFTAIGESDISIRQLLENIENAVDWPALVEVFGRAWDQVLVGP